MHGATMRMHALCLYCVCFWNDFSKEQRSSLRMIYGSKHVGAILSVLDYEMHGATMKIIEYYCVIFYHLINSSL